MTSRNKINKIEFLLVIAFTALAVVESGSKYYDGEIRPYEFGFRMKDNKHRHEKKDTNGIINGEFGFITGDGTYHSSVYATDENGNFKLISFRSSYRLVTTTTNAPLTTSAVERFSREPKSLKTTPILAKTCSHCNVIEKVKNPTVLNPIAVTTENGNIPSNVQTNNVADESEKQKDLETKSNKLNNKNDNEVAPKNESNSEAKVSKITVDSVLNVAMGISTAGIKSLEEIKQKHKKSEESNNSSKSNKIPSEIQNIPSNVQTNVADEKKKQKDLETKSDVQTDNVADENKKQKDLETKSDKLNIKNDNEVAPKNEPNSEANVSKITVDSALNVAMGISTAGIKSLEQIKQKHKQNEDTNNSSKFNHIPSKIQIESEMAKPVTQTESNTNAQLPIEGTNQRTGKAHQPSILSHLSSKKAIDSFIGDVLYRFNYTAGYHGHNEVGDSAGNKAGGYFIVGRDNIRRGVIYVANENGFIPVVKYEKVSSADAPHEDTEKNAGLKGYEFKWFQKGKSDHSSRKK